ncbi:MAG: L-threonylcarbamoyladenylate synthase [Ferrimicrobium sp.]
MLVYDCRAQLHYGMGDDEIVDAFLARLDAGFVVGMPTDTVFGLIASASHARGLASIAALKGRHRDQPPPVLVGSVAGAYALARPESWRLLDAVAHLWPGPLSVVVASASREAGVVNPRDSTIALRVPKHGLLQRLTLHGPLVSSSANLHNLDTPKSADAVIAQLAGASWPEASSLGDRGLTLVLDAPVASDQASTVVAEIDGDLRILREGELTDEVRSAFVRGHLR